MAAPVIGPGPGSAFTLTNDENWSEQEYLNHQLLVQKIQRYWSTLSSTYKSAHDTCMNIIRNIA